MDAHDEVWQALGAWALDACDPVESAQVDAHLIECDECGTEAARLRAAADLLELAHPLAPPASARSRVLSAARAARPAASAELAGLVSGYRVQIVALDAVLVGLDARDWAAPVPRHGSVRELVAHLSANDHALLGELGNAAPAAPADADDWPTQAHLLADRLTAPVQKAVPLAGPAGIRRPVRDAVVQRMFETWVHTEDVRIALRLPGRPPTADSVRQIVALGVALLPIALAASGRAHPGRAADLRLTGEGSGRWTVPLSSAVDGWAAADGRAVVVACGVVADAVDFCRLMAGRLPPAALRHTATGEPAVVADLLHVASLLGCDADV